MWDTNMIHSWYRQLQDGLQILLEEKLPQDCPWHVEVSCDWDNYSEATIILKQWEKTFNIGDLCPWIPLIWRKYEVSSYNPILWTINFNLWEIESKYFLFILLHEIGHSQSKQKDIIKKKMEREFDTFLDILKYDKAGKIKKFFMKEPDRNLLIWETRDEEYCEERFAWSYALKAIKELEKKWFHISQWCTMKEIKLYMNMALFTYELPRDRLWEFSPIIKWVKGKIFRTIYGDQ